MALYDVPIHTGFKILTHTSTRRFAQNGFNQVGNTTLNAHPVNPAPVMRSSIYNKNLSLRGISEAGYGRRYPFYGLSKYAGAGSPRASLRYAGAGSPRASLRYAGAGSPRTSLRYSGAGSPRTSLRDPYINDNPAPGTLGRIGIPGRRTLRGLSQDDISPESDFGAVLPADTSTGFFGTIGNMFSTLFGTAVSSGTQAGESAIDRAIRGGAGGTAGYINASATGQKTTAAGTTNVLGMAIPTTALLLGGGLLAYVALRK